MSYKFKLDEKVRDEVRRIARQQIERAESELAGPSELERAIHEARKCLKRLRSLLRLVRSGLPEKTFKSENAQLRDIAALLSETRDNHVLLQTLTKLGTLRPDTPLMNLRRVALEQNSAHQPVEDPGRTAAAIAGLRAAQARLENLQLATAGFSTLRRGMERTYAHARRAASVAYKKNDSESFHELRKYVQQHWRQTQLLSRAWPELMEAHAAAARELSQILGDDHDLAMLSSFLDGAPKGEIGKMEARQIRTSIKARQSELRALARPRIDRLLAEKPGEFGRRLEHWWNAARSLKKEGIRGLGQEPAAPHPAPLPPQQGTATNTAATEPRAGRAA